MAKNRVECTQILIEPICTQISGLTSFARCADTPIPLNKITRCLKLFQLQSSPRFTFSGSSNRINSSSSSITIYCNVSLIEKFELFATMELDCHDYFDKV